jgi:ethanolamine phosphate phosphodiesterase
VSIKLVSDVVALMLCIITTRMGINGSSIHRQFYCDTFGPSNQKVIIRNHTFLLLDGPGLADEDQQRSVNGQSRSFDQWHSPPNGTVEFVKQFLPGELD